MKIWKILLLAILIVVLFVIGRLVYWLFFEPIELLYTPDVSDFSNCRPNPIDFNEQCLEYQTEDACNQADKSLGCTWLEPQE